MGKKPYYCDYCDKHFTDNPQTRKKHNIGVHHANAKRIHYDQYKGAADLLKDDEMKEPCRRFLSTGECQFGASCRHSHITPNVRQRLNEQVLIDKGLMPHTDVDMQLKLKQWLEENDISQAISQSESSTAAGAAAVSTAKYTTLQLPPCLREVVDLPPSLLPPSLRTRRLNIGPPLDWG